MRGMTGKGKGTDGGAKGKQPTPKASLNVKPKTQTLTNLACSSKRAKKSYMGGIGQFTNGLGEPILVSRQRFRYACITYRVPPAKLAPFPGRNVKTTLRVY